MSEDVVVYEFAMKGKARMIVDVLKAADSFQCYLQPNLEAQKQK